MTCPVCRPKGHAVPVEFVDTSGHGTETLIYVLKTLPSSRKNRAFWHEVMHCLVDHFDRE